MSDTHSPRTQTAINEAVLDVDHLKYGLGERTARGGAIVVAAQIGRAIIQIVTTYCLARLLSPDDFGIIAIGYSVLAFILLFTELGLSTVAIQSRTLNQDTASAMLAINLGITLAAVSFAALSAPVTVWIFKDERLASVIVWLAVSAPISALGSQHTALMMRNMQWMKLQIISLAAMAAGSAVAVLTAWLLHIGYWALIVQSMASAVMSAILAWVACPWRPSPVRDWSGAKSALRFSLHLTGVTMMSFVHRQMDNMLIGWRWGPAELGYYSRAYTLLMLPLNLVTGPLSSAIIPAMSRLQDDPPKWRTAYLDALTVVTIIAGAITALLFGAAPLLIDVVFGPGWDEAEKIFSFLVLVMISATPMNTIVWIYVSMGRTRRMLHWSLMAAPFYVLSFVIGLPYGAVGVAAAYSIAQMLAFMPALWMATRTTNISMRDVLSICLPIIVSTILIGGGLRYVVDRAGLASGISVCILASGLHLWLLGLIVWTFPQYRRVRDRGLTLAGPLLVRIGLRRPQI